MWELAGSETSWRLFCVQSQSSGWRNQTVFFTFHHCLTEVCFSYFMYSRFCFVLFGGVVLFFRGRKGERVGEKHPWEIHWSVASRTPPTGDLAWNPGLCPDWELNQRPFGSLAGTQSTEPRQPGLCIQFYRKPCNSLIPACGHLRWTDLPQQYTPASPKLSWNHTRWLFCFLHRYTAAAR